MGYYDLTVEERKQIFSKMQADIEAAFHSKEFPVLTKYFSDEDTYIRRNAALITGRLALSKKGLKSNIDFCLKILLSSENHKVRQTAVICLGELGKTLAGVFDDLGSMLEDPHHSVRNAVIGAIKQMGDKNPAPAFKFVLRNINSPNPAIRREMVHGIELRGRKHPEEVLPILAEMQFEKDRSVKKMIVHVIGQISYKKGSLEKVLDALAAWDNKDLVRIALAEILKTHKNYEKFSDKSSAEAEKIIRERFPGWV